MPSTLPPFESLHSSRSFRGRSSLPFSCSRGRRQIPLNSGVGHGSGCQIMVRTPEPHPSTYPTFPRTRIHMACHISSPTLLYTRRAPSRLWSTMSSRQCSSPQQPQQPSRQLQLGSLAQPAQGVDGAQKSRLRWRLGAAGTSRSIDSRTRPRGVGGLRLATGRAGDPDGLSERFLAFPTSFLLYYN